MSFKRILVINPNSSPKLTETLDVVINDRVDRFQTSFQFETYTAPSGPPSIDNDYDALMSAKAIMADLQFKLEDYDAYLVACYSVHPLVSMLKARVSPRIHVTGIFEASISTAISILSMDSNAKYGIITSGEYWVDNLSEGVNKYCGIDNLSNKRFKGVEAIGLTSNDLTTSKPEEVNSRIREATKRLVRGGDIRVICLGCAALSGFSGIIGDALKEELGDKAGSVHILDGIHAGLGLIETLIKTFST